MLDDPERLLNIRADGDFRGYRSIPVAKEPWTYEWLKDFDTGDVLYDIGANVGSYSLMAAARGALVYAFEPLAVNYAELVANVQLNNLREKIYCCPIAASSVDGWIPLAMHDRAHNIPGYGLASAESRFKDGEAVYVPSMALSNLSERMFASPTHVKIDVEGHEYMVINGMTPYFKDGQVRSAIIEIADDHTEGQIDNWLNAYGYYGEEAEGSRRSGENRTLIYEQKS
jgi:FkbM family methyltransferase